MSLNASIILDKVKHLFFVALCFSAAQFYFSLQSHSGIDHGRNDMPSNILKLLNTNEKLVTHDAHDTHSKPNGDRKAQDVQSTPKGDEKAQDVQSTSKGDGKVQDVQSISKGEKRILIPRRKKNVLLIIAEDLRPQLSCYGTKTKTPNLDKLAEDGFRFQYAFNQAPICSPSRASLMSGRLPDITRVYGFEDISPDHRGKHIRHKWLDIGGAFQSYLGYSTYASGKLYHYNGDLRIKSEFQRAWPGHSRQWNQMCDVNFREVGKYLGMPQKNASYEFFDEKITDSAIGFLNDHAKSSLSKEKEGDGSDSPFFLAVGFHQPHEPWHFPAKFWDIYNDTEFPVTSGKPPKNMPACGTGDITPQRQGGEMKAAKKIQSILNPEFEGFDPWLDAPDLFGSYARFPDELRREGIRAYSASISFMDSLVGRLRAELTKLGLEKDTVIAFTSDHGLNVGDYGQWGKRQLLDTSARVPMIFYDPGAEKGWEVKNKMGGGVSSTIVESVDLYPTLLELAGGTEFFQNATDSLIEPQLSGESLVKYMTEEPSVTNKQDEDERFAISQLARCSSHDNPKDPSSWSSWGNCGRRLPFGHWTGGKMEHRNEEDEILRSWSWEGNAGKTVLMGYSIRTHNYRYTAWLPWNSTLGSALWDYNAIFMEELYPHSIDDEKIIMDKFGGDLSAIETENILPAKGSNETIQIAKDLFNRMKSRLHGKEGGGDHHFHDPFMMFPLPKQRNLRVLDRATRMGSYTSLSLI